MVEIKKQLNETLKKLEIIKPTTEQIIINVNCGSISDYKTVERFK